MKSVIRDISENAKKLLSTSQILGTAADNTNGTMSQVQQAVSLVVDNSSEQAKNSRNTSDHMKIMGENITETTAEVQNLDQNATFMHSSSENAATEELRKRGKLDDAGGPFYITQLSSRVASSAHLEYHARIVHQKYIRREMIVGFSKLLTLSGDETIDLTDTLVDAHNLLDRLEGACGHDSV